MAKATYIATLHVVTREQRRAWENYTATHNDWLNKTIRLQDLDDEFFGPILYDYYTTDYIHDLWEEPAPEKDLYLPEWQYSPIIPRWAAYNWDGLTWSNPDSYLRVLNTKKAIVTESWLLPDPDDEYEMQEHNSSLEWISDYVSPGQNPDEPITDILYPLLATGTLESVRVDNPKQERVVGMIDVAIYW